MTLGIGLGQGDQTSMQYSNCGCTINAYSCVMMIHFGLYSFPNWPCHSTCFLATDELPFSQFSYNAKTSLQSGYYHLKTNHSGCKVTVFSHGWCFTYTVHALPFYNTSVQYFGNSLWSIFVFNNPINLGFSVKFVITRHGLFLDHFWICWTGHVPL